VPLPRLPPVGEKHGDTFHSLAGVTMKTRNPPCTNGGGQVDSPNARDGEDRVQIGKLRAQDAPEWPFTDPPFLSPIEPAGQMARQAETGARPGWPRLSSTIRRPIDRIDTPVSTLPAGAPPAVVHCGASSRKLSDPDIARRH
jgi:hypothetical protein